MGIVQIRGAILEEVVLVLLEKIGYKIITSGNEGTRRGKAGLEVPGRGEWHQIDALAAPIFAPAFIFPIRLMVEAKCNKPKTKVGIGVLRNSLGVLTDISQNYFTVNAPGGAVQLKRFNYHSAIFSTSGFTINAIRFAIAHQIFPIQYSDVPLMAPIAELIRRLQPDHIVKTARRKSLTQVKVRRRVRDIIEDPSTRNTGDFTSDGFGIIQEIGTNLRHIGGSYFGMMKGGWPLHLLSTQPLSPNAFQLDIMSCRVRFTSNGACILQPSEYEEGTEEWFQLQFSLPNEVIRILQHLSDSLQLPNLKREYFKSISLSGVIGGIRRQIRLQLTEDLLEQYVLQVQKERAKSA